MTKIIKTKDKIMNPLRDNEFSAQEKVFCLQKELAEKDELIKKLTTEPKKSKEIHNFLKRATMIKKMAGSSCFILPVLLLLVGFIYMIEPNNVYYSSGTIWKTYNCSPKIKNNRVYKLNKCSSDSNEDTLIYNVYFSVDGKKFKIIFNTDDYISSTHLYIDTISATLNLGGFARKVTFLDNEKDGCEASVYYMRGKWFNDLSLQTPVMLLKGNACKKSANEK